MIPENRVPVLNNFVIFAPAKRSEFLRLSPSLGGHDCCARAKYVTQIPDWMQNCVKIRKLEGTTKR